MFPVRPRSPEVWVWGAAVRESVFISPDPIRKNSNNSAINSSPNSNKTRFSAIPTRRMRKVRPKLQVVIDRQKAADFGVKAGDVAQALNIFAAGQQISTFSEGTEQYDVVVQADEPFRRDRSNLQYFTVTSASGTSVGLDKLVKLEEGTSPSSISRLNRQRQVTISAGLPPNTSESDALDKTRKLRRGIKYAARIS